MRGVSEPLTSLLWFGSLDGHPLQIKQLRGEETVESIDLSRKGLGIKQGLTVLSAIVIASLIPSNTSTKSLKCVACLECARFLLSAAADSARVL